MPVNNTKGLNPDALLFKEDFESGSLAHWDYVSPGSGVTIQTSQAQGTYSVRSQNPHADLSSPLVGVSLAQKIVDLKLKVRSVKAKFYINVRDNDDPGSFAVTDSSGTHNMVSVITARQVNISATREFYVNSQLYTPLNVGEWYTFFCNDFDFTGKTMSFWVKNSSDTTIISDTLVPVHPLGTDFHYVRIFNQPPHGAGSPVDYPNDTGEVFWDDIEIRGYGI